MTESVEVIFVNSNLYSGPQVRREAWEPLGLGRLQAILENKGISTYLVDAYRDNLSSEGILKEIDKKSPQIVAISAVDYTLSSALVVSRELKKEGYLVNLGGYGPTFQYERCLVDGDCDFVLRGEGEITVSELFPELLKGNMDEIKRSKGVCYKDDGKIAVNPDQDVVIDLDKLPFPLRRDMSPSEYEKDGFLGATINSSRGCYWGNCSFCNIGKYPSGNIYRRRSPENITEEMNMLYDEYGVSIFGDMSPCFLGGKKDEIKKLFRIVRNDIDNPALKFETRADSLLRFRDVIENNLDIIYGIDVGVENFSDAWLERNCKGTTAEDNIKAIEMLQKFKDIKENCGGDMFGQFFEYFTIDFDIYTTIEEFEQHYNILKELGIISLWNPNPITYFPWISDIEEKKYWQENANDFALTLKYMTDNGLNCGSPVDAFKDGRLDERAKHMTDLFDGFLSEIKSCE